MSEDSEWKDQLQSIVVAARLCLAYKLFIPCLMLIYSGIDVAGSMTTENGKASPTSFKAWVDDYLLKHVISVHSDELYGARCGIVHTLRADSRLSQQGQARTIAYAWGSHDAKDLNLGADAVRRLPPEVRRVDPPISLHIDSLLEGFDTALETFLDDVEADPNKMALFMAHSRYRFTSKLQQSDLDELLRLYIASLAQ